MKETSYVASTLVALAVFAASVFALAPLSVRAHAEPVGYWPDSAATVDEAPARVEIRFSERLDDASAIAVTGPSGERASVGRARIDPADLYTLSIPVRYDGDGAYLVSWSAVSSDDGHFTKGAYAFAVGEGQSAAGVASSSVEIVRSSNSAEAVGMAAEFFGNGLAWALLVLIAFVLGPALSKGDAQAGRLVKKGIVVLMVASVLVALSGEVAQVLVKSQSLATVQEVGYGEAVLTYLGTVAGTATLYRALALVLFLTLFVFWRKRIIEDARLSWRVVVLALVLIAFALVRARVSHATASAFAPDASAVINAVHLVAKGLWAGFVAALVAASLSPRLKEALFEAIPRAFSALSLAAGATAVTACYVVWLHLKDSANLFSTQWGSAFLTLSVVAALLVAARLYHVVARLAWPSLFSRLLPFTLAAELGLSLLVLYASSLSAVTSPPLARPHMQPLSASDQGVSITLEESPFEDGMMLLTASGEGRLGEPVVVVEDVSRAEQVSVGLSQRFEGGFAFSRSLLAGKGPFKVSVAVPQEGAYDARATFDLGEDELSPLGGVRSFDGFAAAMAGIAVSGVLFAVVLWILSRRGSSAEPSAQKGLLEISAGAGLILSVALGYGFMSSVEGARWTNPYKALCEEDGNMWHLMLPSKAGKPVSSESREGCMWGMGDYAYMFPDAREYSYYRSLGKSDASLAVFPERPVAGVPAVMTVSVKGPRGEPAELFVDMEKLIHVVVVSEDQTVFAHLHPDDERPLTQAEVESSTFSIKYAFPKSGKYLVSVDYAHGLSLESRQFEVQVEGGNPQTRVVATYASPGSFGGYDVSLGYGLLVAGEPALLRYKISKEGEPVDYLEPYLSAAMHVAVVKNDFAAFLHTHGEVHPPGAPYLPVRVKDGKIVHSMASMVAPARFGPDVEAHILFPEPGLYTVWGQFKAEGAVVPTSFTVRVE